jgi:hypothetical protein
MFEHAVDGFRNFIVGQGWPESIIWRRPEEVLPYPGSKVFVLARAESEADQWARRFYDEGARAGVGICLSAACVVRSQSCSTIFWTLDQRLVSEMMLPVSGLKFSCAVPRCDGKLRGSFRLRLAKRVLDAYHAQLTRPGA